MFASRVDRILELAEITNRKNDPRFRMLIRRLLLRPDAALEEMLLRKLTLEAGDHAIEPPAFRTLAAADMDAGPGPYVRFGHAASVEGGELAAGDEFRFPLVAGHRLVTGSTRTGKSCAVARMVLDVPAGTNTWILDPENDVVYQNLALAAGFTVIDSADFKRNLLEPPPGTPPALWDGHVKRNLRESCFLRDGSISMLSMLLDACRREGHIALRDVFEKLVQLRFRLVQGGREFGFYETLRNRIEGLLINPMFACARGHGLAALSGRNVLFMCGSLGSDEYPLFVNDLLSWLGCYFLPDLDQVPRLLVVLEEVHRLTNPQRLRRADVAEPIVLDAIRTLAKRRVSLLCVDQVPSALPTEILANVAFRALFATIEGRDLDALQRSLSLSHEQRVFISRLPQRACVVQYPNPRFPEPFPVLVDEFELRPGVEAEIAARRAESLRGLAWEPLAGRAPAAAPERKRPLLTKAAQDYLLEIAKDQFVPVSKRDEKLGSSGAKGNALRKKLLAAGVISLEKVDTHSKAKRVVNTRITDAGYELLKSLRVACERPRGKGSWEHVWHQHAVAAWARAHGYVARIEHSHEGKSVDVCLEKDGIAVAAEILCEGAQKELANLRDLHTGYREVWFCVKDRKEVQRLRELVASQFGEEGRALLSRTRFRLLAEFQDAQPTLEA